MNTEYTPPEPDPHPHSADDPGGAPRLARRRLLRADDGPADGRVSDVSLKQTLRGVWLWPVTALLVGCLVIAALNIPIAIAMVLTTSAVQQISIPTVQYLGAASDERTLSLQYLVSPGADRSALDRQRAQTDDLLNQVREAADAQWIIQIAPPAEPIKVRLQRLLDRSAEINVLRARVDGRQLDQDEIFAAYNGITDAGSDMFDTQARIFPDPTVGQGGIQATEYFRATDLQARTKSQVSTALRTGSFNPAEFAQFVRQVNIYHDIVASPASVVSPQVLDRGNRIQSSEHWRRLTEIENRLIAQGPWRSGAAAAPVSLQEWEDLSQRVSRDLNELTVDQADRASTEGWNLGVRNMLVVAGVTVVALVAVVVAIRRSRHNATGLNRRFDYLRDDMEEVSTSLLPAVFERIGRGELPDAASALNRQDYGSDEIAEVKETFDDVVRIALQSSIDQAELQEGMKTVLVGMARRTKVPIRNGVNTIDKLVEFDDLPDDVRDLVFELDQELTRIRRHNENVLILGGEEPGRGWSKPVALPQVVRAAGDETEHYDRVHYENVPKVAIIPSAVADLMHLLAELIDNATSFSRSMVRVQGQKWVNGVLVTIEDQGIGMTDKDLDAANALFAGRSGFDLLKLRNSDRKGHFVVTLLATKHSVRVEMARMYLGGIRATVAIPDALIDSRDVADGTPQRTAAQRPAAQHTAAQHNPEVIRQPVDEATAPPAVSRRRAQFAQAGAASPAGNGVAKSPPSQITRRAVGVESFRGDLLGAGDPAPSAPAPAKAQRADGKRRPLPTRVPQASLDENLLDEAPASPATSEPPPISTRTALEAAERLRGAYPGRRNGNLNGEQKQ